MQIGVCVTYGVVLFLLRYRMLLGQDDGRVCVNWEVAGFLLLDFQAQARNGRVPALG